MTRSVGYVFVSLALGVAACQAQDACPPDALRAVVAEGDAAALQDCLAEGGDPNAATAGGVTPLMLAAARGRGAVVETLLDGGAAVDATTEDGVTALMVAAAWGQTPIVRTLVRRGGADVALEDAGGRTALDWATAAPYTTGDNAIAVAQFLQSPRVGGGQGAGGAAGDLPDLAAQIDRAAVD